MDTSSPKNIPNVMIQWCCSNITPFPCNFCNILLKIVLILPVRIMRPININKRALLNGFGSFLSAID